MKNLAALERQLCLDVAGSLYQQLTVSMEAAQRCLSSEDAKSRLAALYVIRYFWRPTAGFERQYETMGMNDADPTVRAAALQFLASHFANTWDTKVGKLLATIVSNDAVPMEVRRAAYNGLFIVRGLTDVTHLEPSFRIPDDVDWTLVKDSLAQLDVPSEADRLAARFPMISADIHEEYVRWKQATKDGGEAGNGNA